MNVTIRRILTANRLSRLLYFAARQAYHTQGRRILIFCGQRLPLRFTLAGLAIQVIVHLSQSLP